MLGALLQRIQSGRLVSLAALIGLAGSPRRISDAPGRPDPSGEIGPSLSLGSQPAAGGAASLTKDFATRCAAAGVVHWFDCERVPPDVNKFRWGAYPNIGTYPGGFPSARTMPVLDRAVKASGNASLRFDKPGRSPGQPAGLIYVNFSPDLSVQFDSGDEFFVQWRQRFNQAFIDTSIHGIAPNDGVTNLGPSAIKQSIITTGDRPGRTFESCTALELVTNSYYMHKLSTMYQACGSAQPLIDANPLDGNDYRIQNAMPAPYCTRQQFITGQNAGEGETFVPSTCMPWVADEWMTFQVGVKLGPRNFSARPYPAWQGSRVRLWCAREGKASVLVTDVTWDILCGAAADNQRFGKVFLGPYITNGDQKQDHPLMQTWYDEVIVSRQPIADPAVGTLPVGTVARSGKVTSLATLAMGHVRSIGTWSDGTVAGIARTDYSGTAIGDGRLYLFGGAHGPAIDDDIRAFDLVQLKWSSLYPPTPRSDMVASNQDATLGRWISTNHPMVRHTYNAQVVIGRKFYLITQGGGSEYPAGTVCWFDLDARSWSYSKIGHPDWYYASAASVDPVSGKVVIVGTDMGASNWCHVWLYDPASDTARRIVDVTVGTGYMFDLVYLPTRDSFLAIQTNHTLWEIKLDRAVPARTSVAVVTASGLPPAAVNFYPARWRWNGKVLAGCVVDGKLSTLDPAEFRWGSVQMIYENGKPATMQQAYYCLDFDAASGCTIFLARDGNTYAFRM